ncbi:MAG: DUF4411 family protein [Acetobacteraceae bacterium]
MEFSLDTSALIHLQERYGEVVFPGLWALLEKAIAAGRIAVSDEVKRELEKKDDALAAWVRAHPAMIVASEVPIQQRVREILRPWPGLVDLRRQRGQADPFVIAVAEAGAGSVVTDEKFVGPAKPHIPDVCQAMRVRCLTLYEMFVRSGWRF